MPRSVLRVGHVTFTNGDADGDDRLESAKKEADGETFCASTKFLPWRLRLDCRRRKFPGSFRGVFSSLEETSWKLPAGGAEAGGQ
jgi:hypothetical protein